MTKERKIEILKDLLVQLSDSANILCTCEADERCEVVEECIKALEQQPSEGKVSMEVYKQVMSERDIAIEQLRELGYSFGEKIRTSDDCVSRADLYKILKLFGEQPLENDIATDLIYLVKDSDIVELPPVTPTHGTCKDCKHWKDSDGVYRRGVGAESKCPINIKEVYEGNFYCADFEKRGSEE